MAEKEELSEPTGILDTIKERLNNPFFNKFLISWCIWNWKILYVTFFYGENYKNIPKLEYIYKYMILDNYWNIYLWPIFTTIILFVTQGLSEEITKKVISFYEKNFKRFYPEKFIEIEKHEDIVKELNNKLTNCNEKIDNLNRIEQSHRKQINKLESIKPGLVGLYHKNEFIENFTMFNDAYKLLGEKSFNLIIFFNDSNENKYEDENNSQLLKDITVFANFNFFEIHYVNNNSNPIEYIEPTELGEKFIQYLKIRKIITD